MGWGWLMSAMVYGNPWKERRRLFQQYFHPGNAALYQPGQMESVRKVMHRILDAPEEFSTITRKCGLIFFRTLLLLTSHCGTVVSLNWRYR
jgi:cytochrome P450